MFVRDMDLGVPVAGDNRRLEVVVDGLPLPWFLVSFIMAVFLLYDFGILRRLSFG